jgi:hypothetical protein
MYGKRPWKFSLYRSPRFFVGLYEGRRHACKILLPVSLQKSRCVAVSMVHIHLKMPLVIAGQFLLLHRIPPSLKILRILTPVVLRSSLPPSSKPYVIAHHKHHHSSGQQTLP